MSNNKLKFDRLFFREFWQLLKPYWSSEEKWIAFALLGASIVCTVIGVRASVAVNEFNRDFFNALQNFNKAALITSLMHFSIIAIIFMLAYGYAFYFNGLLDIRWRRWLTKNYLEKWLHNHTHYRIQLNNHNIDNPDQRISEDLSQFPATTLSIFFTLFQSTLTLVSFGYILWQLSGNLTIPIGSMHITIPGYLLWGALLYAVIGTRIVGFIGKKLAGLEYQQQRFNANFRFSLVRLRESSEQIAFYRGESNENNKLHFSFDQIFTNFTTILGLRKHLTFFTSGYGIVAKLFGLFMAIPLYFQKKIQLGGMMQIASAFDHVIGASAIFIDGFSLFAEWRAVVSRLTEFNKSMDVSQTVLSGIKIDEHEHNDIIIRDLKVALPDGRILLDNMNFILRSGGSFLLNGRSGLGKSTFLRALAGLWPHGEGKIQLPKDVKIFFLPQKPYLPQGSLKDVLLYPHNHPIDDCILEDALAHCSLIKLHHRLDEVKNWTQELSLGEQQLIAFARLFINKPDIIFLDEASSALDEKTESQVYQNLRKFLPNATIVSIGHRSSLHQLHEESIMLSQQGQKTLDPTLVQDPELG